MRAARARNKRCRGMARNLLKAWPALWTFAKHEGVQLTNNHAEMLPTRRGWRDRHRGQGR
jgi:hypothetical protein